MQFSEGWNTKLVNIYRAGQTLVDTKLVARKWLHLEWKSTCYEKCCRVGWYIDTNVSENIAACIFRISHEELDGFLSR